MALQAISVFTLEFTSNEGASEWTSRNTIESSLSFTTNLDSSNGLQSLSTSDVAAGSDFGGLLYVPTLESNDPCVNASTQYIAKNVTRKTNLPSQDVSLVAIAPWISVSCTKSYLQVASADGVNGFLFYIAHDINLANYTAALPPPPSDPAWTLDDGDAWKSQNTYPVYGINADDGSLIMRELSYYSGNITQVPHGDVLSTQYSKSNYVRLYCDISTSSVSQLPSLWVFLLVILGMLLTIVGITSFLMHYVQKRRRQSLRDRITSGQVDVEALGIKRLTVPRKIVDGLPLSVYVAKDDTDDGARRQTLATQASSFSATQSDPQKSTSQESDDISSVDNREGNTELATFTKSSLPHQKLHFSQPTCPICLEDFVSQMTVVRSLPCTHVFHPSCIDSLLCEYSSLCPVCKGKVLPVGYCPVEVTNVMVRRERASRTQRERGAASVGPSTTETHQNEGEPRTRVAVRGRMASFHRQFGYVRGARVTPRSHSGSGLAAVELSHSIGRPTSSHPDSIRTSANPSAQSVARPAGVSREDWARQRADAMLGTHGTAGEESHRDASQSRWRKAIGTVFPLFA